MAQQINLCSPLHREAEQRFSANSLALALLFVVGGGALIGGLMVWNLGRTSDSYRQTLATQQRDLEGLRASLELVRANTGPIDPALRQQLDSRRAELAQRQALLASIRDGVVRPGYAHSDRLQLVANSIPSPVWVTGLKADSGRIEISGYTLEPAALNEWVLRLGQSPLLQGSQLATVRVDNVSNAGATTAVTAPAMGTAAAGLGNGAPTGRAVWSFNLVSAQQSALGANGDHP